MRNVLTPVASAATSSSRIAAQARPMRECSSPRNASTSDDQIDEQQVPVLQLVLAPRDVASGRGGSYGCGTLVEWSAGSTAVPRLPFVMPSALFAANWMISPNPSVTIAR